MLHKSFDEMVDEDHHLSRSPLASLGVGMVSQFVLDYMHLICLGVVRRLIWLWLQGPIGLGCRLSASTVADINCKLEQFRSYMPSDLHESHAHCLSGSAGRLLNFGNFFYIPDWLL